jgi:hypothetical protein
VSITETERAERDERIRADRVARGLPPTIQAPHVYRLLDAVFAANAEKKNVPQNH